MKYSSTMIKHTEIMICATVLLMIFAIASTYGTKMQCSIPNTIYSGKMVNGSCTVVYKDKQHKSVACNRMKIRIKPNSPNEDACNVSQKTAKQWLASGCKGDFTIVCSKGNISVDLQCSLSESNLIKKINVTVKPEIITKPTNVTVNRVGLPITLTCEVSGDPNHYWVGWFHKNAVIQRGDGHSLSTSPSIMSPNGTTHHLTIHYIKAPGNYSCQVYSIEEKRLDNVTHQVSIKENTAETPLLETLFNNFF